MIIKVGFRDCKEVKEIQIDELKLSYQKENGTR